MRDTAPELCFSSRAVALAEDESWWRRRESNYASALKTRNLFIFNGRYYSRNLRFRGFHTRNTHTRKAASQPPSLDIQSVELPRSNRANSLAEIRNAL